MNMSTTTIERGATTREAPRSAATADAMPAAEPLQLERRRTYDLVTRLLHGVMAISIFVILAVLALGELLGDRLDEDAVGMLHSVAGFILVGAWALRMVWGLVGPAEARLTKLWQPRAWLAFARTRTSPKGLGFGHHPIASAAYLAFYAAIGYLGVSGLLMAASEFELGPLAGIADPRTLRQWSHMLGELHGPAALFVQAFIVLHVVALVWHEKVDGIPWAQSMISGFQYRSSRREA